MTHPSVSTGANATLARFPANPLQDAWTYWIDACQRGLLFLDVLQQRGERYREHAAKVAPHVLKFGCEVVMDGRKLPRPVNYALVRMVPPAGVEIGAIKRPFVIVDPRAGHGPGIGGFKPQSEIGVAFKAGHPCYFIGFLPDPVPGQTIEDIAHAEAAFLERVIALHPQAEGKPAVVGNCQAGWAVMLLAAMRPDLFGPIILAGSPLSYWAGVHGQNPMRYTGGLVGGSWPVAMMGDLGNGEFDGAWIVSNFENLNPSNTLWTKHYNLYSKIDTEEPRYLDFERWWGGFYLLNEDEMRFIVDNLFVGNRLASGEMVTSTGRRIDLRNIRSPIVVFASWGDNITPPQQALNWILDCYPTDREILAREQTIVYILHQDIGHLGIFVSGRIAQREHAQIVDTLDVIETLPPGLWEMVIEDKQPEMPHAELVPGRYLVRFERRTLDDIRALERSREDERPFEAVARMSAVTDGLYRTFVSPWVRACVTEASAEMLRNLHPNRMQYWLWSDRNPWMGVVQQLAETVRRHRRPVAADNHFLALERTMSEQIEEALDRYRDTRDRSIERLFKAMYASAWLQAALGLRGATADPATAQPSDEMFEALLAQKVAALRSRTDQGGLREAVVRILLYAGSDEPRVDVRGFRMAERVRDQHLGAERLPGPQRRELVREQFFLLLLDEAEALAALPRMLPSANDRTRALDMVRQVLSAKGELNDERRARLARVEAILNGSSAVAA